MRDRGLQSNPRFKTGKGGESGQALIELALSMPLLLLLLLGAAEFGRLAYISIELVDAAKAAAQYGSQNVTTMVDTNAMSLVARQSAPYAYNYCTNFTTTTVQPPKCTCMTSGTPNPTTPTTTACTAACAGYIVRVLQVTTSASCNPIFHAIGFSGANITLRGGAVQEVLN
jgi:Flp pilus assembly protein TadG